MSFCFVEQYVLILSQVIYTSKVILDLVRGRLRQIARLAWVFVLVVLYIEQKVPFKRSQVYAFGRVRHSQ